MPYVPLQCYGHAWAEHPLGAGTGLPLLRSPPQPWAGRQATPSSVSNQSQSHQGGEATFPGGRSPCPQPQETPPLQDTPSAVSASLSLWHLPRPHALCTFSLSPQGAAFPHRPHHFPHIWDLMVTIAILHFPALEEEGNTVTVPSLVCPFLPCSPRSEAENPAPGDRIKAASPS